MFLSGKSQELLTKSLGLLQDPWGSGLTQLLRGTRLCQEDRWSSLLLQPSGVTLGLSSWPLVMETAESKIFGVTSGQEEGSDKEGSLESWPWPLSVHLKDCVHPVAHRSTSAQGYSSSITSSSCEAHRTLQAGNFCSPESSIQ